MDRVAAMETPSGKDAKDENFGNYIRKCPNHAWLAWALSYTIPLFLSYSVAFTAHLGGEFCPKSIRISGQTMKYRYMNPLLLTLFVAVIFVPFTASAEETISEAELEFFENRIRPVLVNNCYVCHSAEASTRMGGLSLDTREGIRAGGQRGHAVMPNDVESSVLLRSLAL